jgi:phosphatidylglycerophosphate synthase
MTTAELVARAQRGKDRDPAWYRMHRRLSIGITLLLLPTGVRPTHITLAMMGIWLAGAALVAAPVIGFNVVGFELLYLAFLLDKVDGELARLLNASSGRGILLDRIHHRVIEPTLFLAMAWHDYAARGHVGVLIAGFATAMLANAIEEHQHLAPYIFLKRLREDGGLRIERRGPTPAWRRARAVFRTLKVFRMPLTAMALLFVCELGEYVVGKHLIGPYLMVSAVGLMVYLVFQCVDYYVVRLDEEFVVIATRHRWSAESVSATDHTAMSQGTNGSGTPAATQRPAADREERAG